MGPQVQLMATWTVPAAVMAPLQYMRPLVVPFAVTGLVMLMPLFMVNVPLLTPPWHPEPTNETLQAL